MRVIHWFRGTALGRRQEWPPLVPFTLEERWVLALVFAIGAWVRLHDLDYNTAFNDESINVILGRNFVAGRFQPSPIPWNVGWYLFPLMAWWADQLGGVVGMRVMTGVLGLVTMASVALMTRRISGNREAIAAAIFVSVLAPFVFSGRVAFREAGTIAFLAVGSALFLEACATGKRRHWSLSAFSVFCAFLCKHPIGIFAPPMILIAFLSDRVARRWFAYLLSALLIAYVVLYRQEMFDMWVLLKATPAGVLRAQRQELPVIYGTRRIDIWILLSLTIVALVFEFKRMVRARVTLLAAAVMFALTHVIQRVDANTYKHAAYVLMFIIPTGCLSLGQLFRTRGEGGIAAKLDWLVPVAILLSVPMALAARDWRWTRSDVAFLWPNNELGADYLRAWSGPGRQVLVDDQALGYALWPEYRDGQLVDAYYISYAGQVGAPAYAKAVRDGAFDFVVLDGASFSGSADLVKAITPALAGRYVLALSATDTISGQPLKIYRRINPRVVTPSERVGRLVLLEPFTDSRIAEANVQVRGKLAAPRGGERVQIDVFTNRWWPQGASVEVDPVSGSFEAPVSLGGTGTQRCHHLVRARAYDYRRRLIATTMVVDVVRVDPNDPDPNCERH